MIFAIASKVEVEVVLWHFSMDKSINFLEAPHCDWWSSKILSQKNVHIEEWIYVSIKYVGNIATKTGHIILFSFGNCQLIAFGQKCPKINWNVCLKNFEGCSFDVKRKFSPLILNIYFFSHNVAKSPFTVERKGVILHALGWGKHPWLSPFHEFESKADPPPSLEGGYLFCLANCAFLSRCFFLIWIFFEESCFPSLYVNNIFSWLISIP